MDIRNTDHDEEHMVLADKLACNKCGAKVYARFGTPTAEWQDPRGFARLLDGAIKIE